MSVISVLLLAQTTSLAYAPSPVDNPLRGLVPYQGEWRDNFPHSMEFNYIPLSDLVKGENKYDWTALEDLLNDVASRGHQTTFRVHLEYPGQKNVIPQYLIDGGLKVFKYANTNTQPNPPESVETPDYSDPNLRRCLKNFIRALGAKYDGDPRIGFITAGLLGTWGEWHNYPKDELFAKPNVQNEVLDGYELAFKKTPILLRYPHGKNTPQYAENVSRKFGYHDDSFAWATLDTKKPEDSWFFMFAMRMAGSQALNKWKTAPIGGEVRPEAWTKVFDTPVKDPQIQNFEKCVEQTHVSWLMESGVTNQKPKQSVYDEAVKQVSKMGYEFHIPWSKVLSTGKILLVTFGVENRGVAPFYSVWPTQIALQNVNGEIMKEATTLQDFKSILPKTQEERNFSIECAGLTKGNYKLLFRIKNPMKGGHPVRFANKSQDQDRNGWITLKDIRI